MDDIEREWTGVWIPKEIYLCQDLDEFDIILLTEIHSLSKKKLGCIAGNEHFAEFMRRGRTNSPKAMKLMVQRSIAKMKNLGFVEQISFDGRVRKLRTCLEFNNPITSPAPEPKSDLIQQKPQDAPPPPVKKDSYSNTNTNTFTNDIFKEQKKYKWEIPVEWDSNEFGEYWKKWTDYLHEKNKKKIAHITAVELTRQLLDVSKENWDVAKKIIDRSIMKGYTIFYELPKENNRQEPKAKGEKFDDDYYKQ